MSSPDPRLEAVARLRDCLAFFEGIGENPVEHIEHDGGGTRLHCSDLRAVLAEIAGLKAKVEALEAATDRAGWVLHREGLDSWHECPACYGDLMTGHEKACPRLTALAERGKQEGE